jgi:hypothetical protein
MSLRDWFGTKPESSSLPPQSGTGELTEEQAAILHRLAAKVIEWKMTVPAIMFLESVKPLNYIGAQALVFFEPFVQTLFNFKDYDTFREMMENRENVERLLLKIEELDAEVLQKEREARAARRAASGRRRRWWWPFGRRESPPLEGG